LLFDCIIKTFLQKKARTIFFRGVGMPASSITKWSIAILTFAAFILTFFILFRDTNEIFSSLTAAILSSFLTLGALIVMSWFAKVFMK
jgi:hypothetical protein